MREKIIILDPIAWSRMKEARGDGPVSLFWTHELSESFLSGGEKWQGLPLPCYHGWFLITSRAGSSSCATPLSPALGPVPLQCSQPLLVSEELSPKLHIAIQMHHQTLGHRVNHCLISSHLFVSYVRAFLLSTSPFRKDIDFVFKGFRK